MTEPLIWPSLLRLVATGAIFIFHYLGLFGYPRYRIDFFAILVFCFLSGYLAKVDKSDRAEWFIKKYFDIMVCYWIVIVPVIITNEIVEYKNINFLDGFLTFFGGNLFLEDPLYVIAWYVTFVLILYSYLYMESFLDSYWFIFFSRSVALFFSFIYNKEYYFFAFFVGLWMSKHFSRSALVKSTNLTKRLSLLAFKTQKYCYSFFLVHGAVLLFFVKMFPEDEFTVFLFSAILSMLFSLLIFPLGRRIGLIVTSKTISLTRKVSRFV